jgi:DNA-binding Xre family transcriptional regulator
VSTVALIPSYKPLEITLIKRDKLRKHLREELGISGTTLAKMSNNEFVSLQILAQICEYLDCRIEEVVEFVPDTRRPTRPRANPPVPPI